MRVPAVITTNGMPCSAATPATRAWVPSPPATPSRSAPRATASRATAATSTGSGPSIRNTSAPRLSALRFRSNLPTFPPPDFGFMIRNGCAAGGWAGYSGIRQSVSVAGQRQPRRHAREQPHGGRQDRHPQQAGERVDDDHRDRRKHEHRQRQPAHHAPPGQEQYAAARLTAAPARPTASIAKLFSPAKATTTTTARHASSRLSRASQRCERVASGPGDLCMIAIIRDCQYRASPPEGDDPLGCAPIRRHPAVICRMPNGHPPQGDDSWQATRQADGKWSR